MSGVSQSILVDPSTQAEMFQSGKAGAGYVLLCDTAGNPSSFRTSVSLDFSSGASVSQVLDLQYTNLVGFIMPAAWTAATVSIDVSTDNAIWSTAVYGPTGTAISTWAAPTAGAAYAVDAMAMLGFRYIRLRSGTVGAPVVQTAIRTFTMLTLPIA